MSQQELPTPEQMKKFSDLFSKEQWQILCDNQAFLDCFTLDLDAALALAKKVLK
jgi:hypothetical protein